MTNRLSWIDDSALERSVSLLLKKAMDAKDKATTRIRSNVIDPFASLVLARTLDIDKADILSDVQGLNSASSGISSAVGNFHQEILGSTNGFVNHDSGYDLECSERKIIAEVKNKHNTMNASNRDKVITELDTAIRQKAGTWVACLVVIVPKKPIRYKKKVANREVYEIDGSSFYELATGSGTALHDLYHAVSDIALQQNPKQKEVINYCAEKLTEGIPQ